MHQKKKIKNQKKYNTSNVVGRRQLPFSINCVFDNPLQFFLPEKIN